MRSILVLTVLLAAGCVHKLKPTDYEATPILPSPKAGTYARVATVPEDPVIATLFRHRPWDASLAGAAAGLALDAVSDRQTGLNPWEVREAAWRSGYPYPVTTVMGWTTEVAEPPAGIEAWIAAQAEEDDVALVRARNARGEAWVGLVGKKRPSVGIQPRQIRLRRDVVLPAIEGGRYVVSDPDGTVWQGGLEQSQSFAIGIEGEWLFQISDQDGLIALFPVYAGMTVPELDLIPVGTPPRDAVEVITRAQQVLTEIRGAYGAAAWSRDPLLDRLAERALHDPEVTAATVAGQLGYSRDQTWRWECTARSFEGCLDQLLWDPLARPALLTPSQYLGLGAEIAGDRVHVVAFVATEPPTDPTASASPWPGN